MPASAVSTRFNRQACWLALFGLVACRGETVGILQPGAGGAGGSTSTSDTVGTSTSGGNAGMPASGGSAGAVTSTDGSQNPGGQAGAPAAGGAAGAGTNGGARTIPSSHASLVLEYGDPLAAAGIRALAVDADDNVVLTGFFGGDIDFGNGVRRSEYQGTGSGSLFVLKLSPAGEVLWSNVFPVHTCCEVADIAVDSAGDIAIVGAVTGDSDFGDGAQSIVGTYDAYLTKLRGVDGRVLFSRRYGSEGIDFAYSVTTDAENNIYTAGEYAGPVSFAEGDSLPDARGLYVARFDPEGNLNWVRGYATTMPSRFRELTFTAPERLIATGDIYSATLFGQTQLAPQTGVNSSGVLAEFDRTGSLLSAREVLDGGTLPKLVAAEGSWFIAGSHDVATSVAGLMVSPWTTWASPFIAALDSVSLQARWVQTLERDGEDVTDTWISGLERDSQGLLHAAIRNSPALTTDLVTLTDAGEVLVTRALGVEALALGVDSHAALWLAGRIRVPFDFGDGLRDGPIFISKFEPEAFE